MDRNDIADLDPLWYLNRYPDVAQSSMEPSDHFSNYGRREGRIPNARAEKILNEDDFDLSWYASYYADVLDQDIDPISHYLTKGRGYEYHPNARVLLRADLIESFDPIWYRFRNRDVAESGMDLLEHFLTYGYEEGRSPNERSELRSKWRGWFDAAWYTAKYKDVDNSGLTPLEHYLRLGVYQGRAPNTAEEDRAAWEKTFDADWYVNHYGDVACTGLPPIEHFINYGIISGRRPNATTFLAYDPVDQAILEVAKTGILTDRVALFITHAPGKRVKPHVEAHLRTFKQASISVVLIIASNDFSIPIHDAISDAADIIYRRQNKGYDFAAWSHIMRLNQEIFLKKEVFLVNDSIFGPFTQEYFQRLLLRIAESDADIVGLTDNYQLGWHLQSYFLVIKERALNAPAFRLFINGIVSYGNKNDVIYIYETQFARTMEAQNLRCEAIYKSKDVRNSTLEKWRELTLEGMPYIKASLFNRLANQLDIVGWREHLHRLDYDTRQADDSIAETILSSKYDEFEDFSGGLVSQRVALHDLHKFFAAGAKISIKNCGAPILSIVLCVRNRAEFVYATLKKATLLNIYCDVEIAILDHSSIDDTIYLSKMVEGCSFHRLPMTARPADFLCKAAEVTRGRSVVLLNNILLLNETTVMTLLFYAQTLKPAELVTGILGDTTRYYRPIESVKSDDRAKPPLIGANFSVAERIGKDPLDYVALIRGDTLRSAQLSLEQHSLKCCAGKTFSAVFDFLGLKTRLVKDLLIITI